MQAVAYRIAHDKLSLQSAGSCTQRPAISRSGRGDERQCVCVCVTAAFCCTADNLVNQLYLVSTVGKKELKIPQATE